MALSTKAGWRTVDRDNPCPVCLHAGWCRITDDGSHVACHRVEEGSYRTRTYSNGQLAYLHRRGDRAAPWTIPPAPTAPAVDPVHGRADDADLGRMYARLLSLLVLNDRHRRELLARGLPDDAIRAGGFVSWPGRGRADLLRRLVEDFSTEQLVRLPGVWHDGGRLRLAGESGLTIPVHDHEGRVVAVALRPDRQVEGRKYIWLSSRPHGGPGPGARAHIPPFTGDRGTVRITEGMLKAAVATALSGTLTIGSQGLPGKACLKALAALGTRRVLLALDMDKEKNEHVRRAEAGCLRALLAAGYEVAVEEWEGFKGIDDALKAGAEIRKRTVKEDDMAPDRPTNTQSEGDEVNLSAFHLTDLGNAQRLVAAHGANIRFCAPWRRWLCWDGRRWAEDDTGAVDRLARGVIAALYRQAGEGLAAAAVEPDEGRRKAEVERFQRLVKHALGSEMVERLTAMVKVARAEPSIPVRPNDLDAAPWLFNCPNGTIHLRTGDLRPHRRDDLITKLCPTPFDPSARCPAWESALLLIFGDKPELVAYFRRLCGYCLTGDVREQILPIPWGDGSNGKSLLFDTLLGMIGPDYGGVAPDELLMLERKDTHPTALADLFGKRLVVASETGENCRLNEALVKKLTGGDTIKARKMRQDFWEFPPTHKLFLVTNHRPEVRGTDHGIWRRLRLLPFTTRFWDPHKKENGPPNLRADKTLKAKLLAEAPGILAWCVRGCLEWQERGLQEPDEVRLATEDFKGEMDVVGRFIADCCHLGQGCKWKAGAVYARYQKWHKENGEHGNPMSQRSLGQCLRRKGIEARKSSEIWYVGLMLAHEAEDDPPRSGF